MFFNIYNIIQLIVTYFSSSFRDENCTVIWSLINSTAFIIYYYGKICIFD